MKANRFQDKVALITGGNSGIGRATAIAFAREGAMVVIAARRENLGNEVVNEIENNGGRAVFIKTDVTLPEDVEKLINTVVSRYGRLDYAFNNAGVGSYVRSILNTTMEEWRHTINTNLKGVWLCMKYELHQMLKQGGGVIVNNSSVAGLRGEAGMSIYCASKHGVLGLTKAAALEYAHRNIRINTVCPGFVHTPMLEETWSINPKLKELTMSMIPMKRFGKPEEIASAVLWMCSDEASFMTGKELVIGGGQTIKA